MCIKIRVRHNHSDLKKSVGQDDSCAYSKILRLDDMIPNPGHVSTPLQEALHGSAGPIKCTPASWQASAERYIDHTCSL